MRKWIVVAVLAVAGTAHADRCADGVAALAKHDLPHAAFYLDGCDDAEPKAMRELHKKLEASELSVLEVVSNPSGLDAEIDALPGERFTTPKTLFLPAGTYKVSANGLTNEVATKAHARSLILLERTPAKPPATKDGVADFRDDAPTDADPTGPPPVVAHRPMMPCKFTNTCTDAGEAIDDPL